MMEASAESTLLQNCSPGRADPWVITSRPYLFPGEVAAPDGGGERTLRLYILHYSGAHERLPPDERAPRLELCVDATDDAEELEALAQQQPGLPRAPPSLDNGRSRLQHRSQYERSIADALDARWTADGVRDLLAARARGHAGRARAGRRRDGLDGRPRSRAGRRVRVRLAQPPARRRRPARALRDLPARAPRRAGARARVLRRADGLPSYEVVARALATFARALARAPPRAAPRGEGARRLADADHLYRWCASATDHGISLSRVLGGIAGEACHRRRRRRQPTTTAAPRRRRRRRPRRRRGRAPAFRAGRR